MTTLGYLRGVREWAYPMRTTTAFLEKGVLTPEEFVRAGDELVFRCPTWSWESGEISKQRNFLPPDKQYLITRNVPCPTRVIDMEQRLLQTQVFKGTSSSSDGSGDNDDDDEEWLMSTLLQPNEVLQQQQKTDEEGDIEDEFDIVDETGEIVEPSPQPSQDDTTQPKTSTTAAAVQEMDDYADMADFEDDNVLTDEDAAAAAAASSTTTTKEPITPPTATTTSTTTTTTNTDHNEYLVKVRTYDLSITYDKYYQTPRVWMIGTSDTGQPLTAQEMMQDVMTDYAHKTVTIETHPHVAGPHASIHPCQHGKVMKRIVQNLMRAAEAENHKNKDGTTTTTTTAEEPTVEVYLFIFLKFVNSIIPTINYDFTMDVTASTQVAS